MNVGKTVFSQLMEFLPQYEFQKCGERYQGNYKIQPFSCWDQFRCRAFAQLTYRESLRDLQVCLRGNQQKLYHTIWGRDQRNILFFFPWRSWRLGVSYSFHHREHRAA